MQQFDLMIVGGRLWEYDPWPGPRGLDDCHHREGQVGGTCLNRGCIPSKMLIHAADVAETIHTAAPLASPPGSSASTGTGSPGGFGSASTRWPKRVSSGAIPSPTPPSSKARRASLVTRHWKSTGSASPHPGDPGRGSRPAIPDIPGLGQVVYHTSDTIMRLPRQPQRMVSVEGTSVLSWAISLGPWARR